MCSIFSVIEFGKLYGSKIVTNDFNLNKVAQLHGVEVLNINELANALKPVVLPGETMLTRTPFGARSIASDLHKGVSAAFTDR